MSDLEVPPGLPAPPWWFFHLNKNIEAVKTVAEQARDAAREAKEVGHEAKGKIASHLTAHGLGTSQVSASLWVAPTAMHIYHARWRLIGGSLVLLGLLAPRLKSIFEALGKLVGP